MSGLLCKLKGVSPVGISLRRSCHVTVKRETLGKHSVAVVSIRRPPVNSFDLTLAQQFNKTIKDLHIDGESEAIVISSSVPNVFSAGLDLAELYQPSKPRLEEFWRQVQEVWLNVYSSRLPLLAVINGHCLAGGTIIAAACDYRIAVKGDYSIGVTAAKVGVIAPPWFLKMLTHMIGQRTTEYALQLGQVFTPDDAKAIGLIDEVCDQSNMSQRSHQVLSGFLSVFQDSRSTMKHSLRSGLINNFLASRDEDMAAFVSFIMQDSVQENLGNYIKKLKKN